MAHLKERYLRYICVHANGERHLQKIGIHETDQLLLRAEVAVPQHVHPAQLNLELQDRTLQRGLIEPPKEFAIGQTSIGDHDRVRMEKVKLYFPSAFGGRKFS